MTEQSHTAPEAQPDFIEDVESDPALSDRKGFDWTDEGGATSLGPATHTPLDPEAVLSVPKPGPPKKRMI